MPNVQNVFILGHAGRDAEIKTNGEKQWASFSIAVTDFPDNNTTWYRCSVWGKAAQRAVEKIKKGDTVMVQGKQKWNEKGIDVSVTDWQWIKSSSKADATDLANSIPSKAPAIGTGEFELPF